MSRDALGLNAEQRKLFEALLAQKGIAPAPEEHVLGHDEAGRFAPSP